MKTSNTVNKMIVIMLAAALIIIIAGAAASVFYPVISILPFSLGVLLMTSLNIVKVVWLEKAVQKAVDMEDQTIAGNYIRMQYLFRLLLTGLVFVIAIIVPIIDLWGALAGIFTFHAAKYALVFIVKTDDENTNIL